MPKASEAEASEVVFDAPPPVSDEEMLSERPARLLETGEYADKGLTVTEADLDAIVSRFTAGLPVKVEHLDSPLDPLGRVVRVWREGNALLGMLAFPDDLAGFLRRRGAAKLSVGLTRKPLALKEVSLVLKPRVASAALLSADSLNAASLNAEIGRLRAALSAQEVDAQVTALKAQGRVVPASEAAARALLGTEGGEAIRMAGGFETVASVFRRFLAAQPPVVVFGDLAPAGGDLDGFTHTEHMFLSHRLGVNPKDVATLIESEQKEKTHAH